MSSVVISGNTSGTITLDAPAVAGTTVLTLPATSGTVLTTASTFGGTGPAFSAYANASTTLSNGASTKILFQLEEFDTNSNFASSRFTPTVAGYYQINSGVGYTPGAGSNWVAIHKNGTEYFRGARYVIGSALIGIVSALVYCNGSSDYIEIYAFTNGGGSPTTTASQPETYFTGAMVRSA